MSKTRGVNKRVRDGTGKEESEVVDSLYQSQPPDFVSPPAGQFY